MFRVLTTYHEAKKSTRSSFSLCKTSITRIISEKKKRLIVHPEVQLPDVQFLDRQPYGKILALFSATILKKSKSRKGIRWTKVLCGSIKDCYTLFLLITLDLARFYTLSFKNWKEQGIMTHYRGTLTRLLKKNNCLFIYKQHYYRIRRDFQRLFLYIIKKVFRFTWKNNLIKNIDELYQKQLSLSHS